MSLKRLLGLGERSGNPSRAPRDARLATDADHDRELAETFEFVGEGKEGKEVEPVFEEVPEEGDRTERLARNVLDAQADVDRAASDRRLGKEKEGGFALELASRGLAQTRVEQAQYNFNEGKGTQGQLDQAIRELGRAEKVFQRSEEGAEALARYRAQVVAKGGVDIGGASALQIAGRRRGEAGSSGYSESA